MPAKHTSPWWYRPLFYVILFCLLVAVYGTFIPRRVGLERPGLRPVRSEMEARLASLEQRLSPERILQLLPAHPPLALAVSLLLIGGGGLLLTGLALDARWLWRWRTFQEFLQTTQAHRSTMWSLGDVWRVAILTLWWMTVFPFVELGYTALWRLPRYPDMAQLLVSSTYLCLLILAMIWFLARAKGHTIAAPVLGLQPCPQAPLFGRGVAGYITLAPSLLGSLLVAGWIAARVGYMPPAHPLSLFFLEERRVPWLCYGVMFTCGIAPAVEEILFRGVLFPALRNHMPFWLAAAVSAVLFGALHANWVSFLPITWLGLLLAYLYETTGSLYASITVHALHNSLMVVVMLCYRALAHALGT